MVLTTVEHDILSIGSSCFSRGSNVSQHLIAIITGGMIERKCQVSSQVELVSELLYISPYVLVYKIHGY